MSRRVVVIGGGASGTAAAYAARQAGASVTVVVGPAGASALGSGALDGPPLASLGPARSAVASFVASLGMYEVLDEGCHLATNAGLLRTARGRDRNLLDVGPFQNGVVAVVDASRPGWDATGLARAWSQEPWAVERGVRFESVAVDVLRHAQETAAPDIDLAAAHDDPSRVAWLVERLRKAPALEGKCGVLMGPWLGARLGIGARVSGDLGKPVGEPLSAPGGVAGLRFEAARDDLLAKIGATSTDGFAVGLTSGGATPAPIRVELANGETIDADAAVLALGGLAAGGIRFVPELPFALSLTCAAVLAMRGVPLVSSGSPHGAPFETFAWNGQSPPAGFERVGVWVDAIGRLRAADGSPRTGLFAAGDVAADAPRTLLEAFRSGVVAGRGAALVPGATSLA
jgi:glycerol-3-phosphate dehydrogenase subunit B